MVSLVGSKFKQAEGIYIYIWVYLWNLYVIHRPVGLAWSQFVTTHTENWWQLVWDTRAHTSHVSSHVGFWWPRAGVNSLHIMKLLSDTNGRLGLFLKISRGGWMQKTQNVAPDIFLPAPPPPSKISPKSLVERASGRSTQRKECLKTVYVWITAIICTKACPVNISTIQHASCHKVIYQERAQRGSLWWIEQTNVKVWIRIGLFFPSTLFLRLHPEKQEVQIFCMWCPTRAAVSDKRSKPPPLSRQTSRPCKPSNFS